MSKLTILFFAFLFFIASCKPNEKYTVAIHDFSRKHQPALVSIVWGSREGNYVEKHFTKEELIKLSNSEHPVLRLNALYILKRRSDINELDLIYSHLDDTAIVDVEYGEFGMQNEKIIDALILKMLFKTENDRDKLAEKVILEHNNLRAAYIAIQYTDLKPAYYQSIKQMVMRKQSFENLSLGLSGLARFKKEEDVDFIRGQLLKHYDEINWNDFKLMEDFPNAKYLDVLEQYVLHQMKRDLSTNNGFGRFLDFVHTTASYKSKQSAAILDSAIKYIAYFETYRSDTYYSKFLAEAVWKNKCTAYEKLLSQTKKYWIDMEEAEQNRDTSIIYTNPKRQTFIKGWRWVIKEPIMD